MTLRVVLLAEGAGETEGAVPSAGSPGEVLPKEMCGPGHVLVRRALAQARGVVQAEVRFELPLRNSRGGVVRGGQLLDRGTLRKLLSWARPTARPDLSVLLVDADGEHDRAAKLREYTSDLPGVRAIGVAVQEFESWLLADENAVRQALSVAVASVASPENLKPREAKRRLNALCDGASPPGEELRAFRRGVRLRLSESASLEVLERQCASFRRFLAELGEAG